MKRYTQFEKLHENLSREIKDLLIKVPEMPSKLLDGDPEKRKV